MVSVTNAAANGTRAANAIAMRIASSGKAWPMAPLFSTLTGATAQAVHYAAMAYVLEALVNYGKQNGPWTDRTGYLRRSYTWQIGEGSGGKTVGIFANVADYAKYIEFMPNRWVLSGAVDAMQPVMSAMLGSQLHVSNLKVPSKTWTMNP